MEKRTDTIKEANVVILSASSRSRYIYIPCIYGKEAKIVSGKFSGSLFRKNGTTFFLSDSINIQQGRFDIKYSNYP